MLKKLTRAELDAKKSGQRDASTQSEGSWCLQLKVWNIGSAFETFLHDIEDQQQKLIYLNTTVYLQNFEYDQENDWLDDNKPKWLRFTATGD